MGILEANRKNEKVFAELKGIPAELEIALHEESVLAGELIRGAIIKKMNSSRKQGRVYNYRGVRPGEEPDKYHIGGHGKLYGVVKRDKPHRSSAPGQAPATDSGELVSRILSLSQNGGVEVGALSGENKVPIWLEEGTRYMKARPYLLKTFEEKEKNIEKDFAKAIERILS